MTNRSESESKCRSGIPGLVRIACIAIAISASGLLPGIPVVADTSVLQRVDSASAASEPQLLNNPGFEEGDAAPAPAWYFWKDGYTFAPGEGRGGAIAIQCASADRAAQHGAGQTVQLNQAEPLPLIVTGWSRAQDVNGPPGRDYAIYIDAMYTDDTPLWGVVSCFSTGTHDWEERRCVVLPEKPLRSITVYALFRGHAGTAWFDDFALYQCGDVGIHLFENVPVTVPARALPEALSPSPGLPVTKRGLALDIGNDPARPATTLFLDKEALGYAPLVPFVRDVAADSGFVAGQLVLSASEQNLRTYEWEVGDLALTLRLEAETDDECIRLNGAIEDLRGSDRAVTIYVPIPLQGSDWMWWRDMRRNAPALSGVFMNTQQTNAGATGECSIYPLAALTGPNAGIALATPMTNPRHCRLAYDASVGILFAAFDLGLSRDTAKFPQTATFEAVVYAFDPAWGFRAALERYYALFPECFVKRVDREGLWMAFSDISKVNGWEDFGFAFKEGTNNVPWDEEHGILTFVYTEPMTTWLPLPKETPRDEQAAVAHITSMLESDDAFKRRQASITLLSSVHDAGDSPLVYLRDTPWCDGALFPLNADPDLPTSDTSSLNQAQGEWSHLKAALSPPERDKLADWNHYERGYEVDNAVFASGNGALRVSLAQPGKAGATQNVPLNQTQPVQLVLRARVKTQGLTGDPDNDCAVYVDLVHTDGTPLWGQTLPVSPGDSDFVTLERTIESTKPFKQATVHLLMRGNHSGTVWFDDLFLGEPGSGHNLLRDPGFEGTMAPAATVDGVYIDSFVYFATTLNYRREHFASTDFPLVFEQQSGRVGILTLFSTFEFERETAAKVHGQGKLMMANAPLHGCSFPAAYLDVLGTETNWFPQGKWQPMTDESMAFRRAMCFQKPYCFLLNTHYVDLTLDDIERYIQRCLFYGMHPGLFSENASTDCFFENPDWYEPARPLFKKYIPLIQTIAKAGWQPVTHAQTSGGSYIERYGTPDAGPVYFSLLNETDVEIRANVHVDITSLGLEIQSVRVEEMVTGETPAFDVANKGLQVEIVLPAHSSRLLHVAALKNGG
ncbi:MAG TPA: hypothetical protein PKY01_00610 [Candidatus Hydrogenedentes bacterium]|nr:hypothetical protein [Candidatus Hydrogenedentota bacterium]